MTILTLRLKTSSPTVLQNEEDQAVRASLARCEIKSTVLEVLPEDQSKILGNPPITLTLVVVEVEVALKAVVVVVVLEVEEVANDSASRDELLHEVNHREMHIIIFELRIA